MEISPKGFFFKIVGDLGSLKKQLGSYLINELSK